MEVLYKHSVAGAHARGAGLNIPHSDALHIARTHPRARHIVVRIGPVDEKELAGARFHCPSLREASE